MSLRRREPARGSGRRSRDVDLFVHDAAGVVARQIDEIAYES
jgi:hypothetical protein